MKKLTAVLLACVMLFSVAFALPMTFSVMPRTGFFNSQVDVDAGKTWTSYKYEIPSSYENVYLDADLVGGNYPNVKNTYTYYYFKVINNNSSTNSAVVVKLYA